MVSFIPFRGIHYNGDKIQDLSSVVCPPYDVISPEEQNFYYDLHPCNAIRLDLTKGLPGDNETENRYTRSAANFQQWLEEGILVQDQQPAYYLLEERFEDTRGNPLVRYGLIGLARLEENHAGASIRPHETTHAGPKKDRFELMKSTEANFSPIFSLYQDDTFMIQKLFEKGPADGHYLKAEGQKGQNKVCCRMFPVYDPQEQQKIEAFLKDKLLLIADGHHRYETALKFRDWKRSQGAGRQDALSSYDYTMMYVTNIESPGLCLYPTHRILKQPPVLDFDHFVQSVQEHFEVQKIGPYQEADAQKRFLRRLKEGTENTITIGCCFKKPEICCLLIAKSPEKVMSLFPEFYPELVRSLDVSILHEIILNQCLGISKDIQDQGEILIYVKGEEATLSMLEQTPSLQAAFLLNPSSIQKIMQIAFSGIRLPQKTTYFFPKLLTGLFFRKMDESAREIA